MWANSKRNSDALVFRNRNIGHFSIGCFHECKISRDFAIICFCQNTQLKKYCIWFLRQKMLETRLARSSHKILYSVQILSSNSKILRKVCVDCQLSKYLYRMIFQKFSHALVFTKSNETKISRVLIFATKIVGF